MSIKVKLLDKKCMPVKQHETDGGFDIYSREDASVFPQDTVFVKTGVCVAVPEGYVALLIPRSSLSKTPLRLANSLGVIDSNFTGEIQIPFYNTSDVEIVDINKYERYCQLVIVPIIDAELEIVGELEDTDRGSNGFGSTGRE